MIGVSAVGVVACGVLFAELEPQPDAKKLTYPSPKGWGFGNFDEV